MTYTAAIIGTGADPESRSRNGYAMGYRHAPGYLRNDRCELIACADIVGERARTFADHFDIDQWFESHIDLVESVDPDIISICVPPAKHAELVIDCARRGDPLAIHCEKPMATTWGDCQAMVAACDQADVQLTIGHQRRLAAPVEAAKARIDRGEIGSVRRVEWSEANLFDAGSHLFDLCDHLLDGPTPEWALAGVATDPDNRWFGAINDAQGIATWGYDGDIVGLASTAEDGYPTAVDPYLRIVGEEGIIEIEPPTEATARINTGDGWEAIDTGGETVYRPNQSLAKAATNRMMSAIPVVSLQLSEEPTHYERAIDHVVSCVATGREPLFSGTTVCRSTELIFACYESARRRDRVELPLDIEDNPLESIVAEPSTPAASD